MKKVNSVQEYIENHSNYKEELQLLRQLINKTALEETIKWSAPTYTLKGKNVLGLGAFKSYVGIWFFNGAFLTDAHKLLINAQVDKTKGMRQMRFDSLEDIKPEIVSSYIEEAIKNEEAGLKIKPTKSSNKDFVLNDLLKEKLDADTSLNEAFEQLTFYKQKEFSNHIDEAKREATKISRLEKIIPIIQAGKGLYDKYKNC